MKQTKFRGVSAHKDGGWISYIGHQGKNVYLGWFRDFEPAKAARLDAEMRLFGAHFDRREIEIQADHANIPLHGRNGVFYGWATVDLGDIEAVKGIAWTIDPRGYVAGKPSGHGSSVTMHRWLMFGGEKGGKHVDHADGDRLNNRRRNLRPCTPAENSRNTKLGKNNTSGAKGVSKTAEGRWRARIWKDRREIRLGVFDRMEDAAAAYDQAAAELHGEFASPNVGMSKQYGERPGVFVRVVELYARPAR
ncbi:MAG: HNH endonuclease [Steroidobacteraceae bacterium]|nr:HNH endonuclease [Steroidobacteraceae bacterium]